jgi:hypothetical protein
MRCSRVAALLGAWLLLALPVSAADPPRKKEPPPKVEGRLIVEDGGGLFSPEAIRKAKGVLSEVRDTQTREMTIMSFREVPASRKAEFEKLTAAERPKYFAAWAAEEARGAKVRGVFVFITRSPGHVQVLADKQIRDKGFTLGDEERVRDLLLEKLRESAKAEKDEDKQALRDKGLLAAAEYVRDSYKKMVK